VGNVLHALSHRLQHTDRRLDLPEDWLVEACHLTRAAPWWVREDPRVGIRRQLEWADQMRLQTPGAATAARAC
jgi:hypothetical protein